MIKAQMQSIIDNQSERIQELSKIIARQQTRINELHEVANKSELNLVDVTKSLQSETELAVTLSKRVRRLKEKNENLRLCLRDQL